MTNAHIGNMAGGVMHENSEISNITKGTAARVKQTGNIAEEVNNFDLLQMLPTSNPNESTKYTMMNKRGSMNQSVLLEGHNSQMTARFSQMNNAAFGHLNASLLRSQTSDMLLQYLSL